MKTLAWIGALVLTLQVIEYQSRGGLRTWMLATFPSAAVIFGEQMVKTVSVVCYLREDPVGYHRRAAEFPVSLSVISFLG